MVRLAVIADEFPPSHHLTHSKKTQNFCEDDSDSRDLFAVGVADRAQHGSRVDGAGSGACGRHDGSRVPEHVDQRLKVGLELGDSPREDKISQRSHSREVG